MTNIMLIDSVHKEETRTVLLSKKRVEEFDFESETKRSLRGNIYLAKVTRIEPSLQAAFIEYGGNRRGFLAFNEIHPDYYNIPIEDKQRLLREQEAEQLKDEADEDISAHINDDNDDESSITNLGGKGEEEDGVSKKPRTPSHKYKIQEVIKPNQIILIQVVKEERGNKGAALTTYLSLAGRYCVLMPNTARGGGISRKISNRTDREKLKKIAKSLDVPKGMGLIIRTAGMKLTKAEIKRDYEYLIRMWENVRELTIKSTAPCLVYEEGSLIKRCIRDLYTKETDEIIVDGEEAFSHAKEYMKMLMPSHAKKVKLHDGKQSLFQQYGVESQVEAMFHPIVYLKSGGYMVINPTEALIAVDVNSGRATGESNIESTALKTNLETAEEIARQMRLRDLAGLIIIDFIDMEDKRNNRAVEQKLKECLKNDRARIQISRISNFGLLEMSRQRMRSGVVDASSIPCPHCAGSGMIRSIESRALHVLRRIEAELVEKHFSSCHVHLPDEVAHYLLHQKRSYLDQIESKMKVKLFIRTDETLNMMEMSIQGNGQQNPKVMRMDGAQEMRMEPSKTRRRRNGQKTKESNGEAKPRKRGKRGGKNRNANQEKKEETSEAKNTPSPEKPSPPPPPTPAPPAPIVQEAIEKDKPKRKGWWKR